MVNERKVKLVNRAVTVAGGTSLLALFAYLLATGSPLAGTFLAGVMGCAFGYGLVRLAVGGLASLLRDRRVRTVVLALVAVLSMTAGSLMDIEYSAADSLPDLFAYGLFFGAAFAAVTSIFTPAGRTNAR